MKNLVIAGRTPSKVKEVIESLRSKYPDVNYRHLQLDLSSQKNVRTSASELLSWNDLPSIDILVNNAAIMNIPERTINEDGIEITFATNYIGHFLFTNLILSKLIKASESNEKGATRIVNVSSGSPQVAQMRWSDLLFEKVNNTLPEEEQPSYFAAKMFGNKEPETKTYLPIEAYNQSKVANVLHAVGLNARLFNKYGILSLAIHPGIIETELSRDAPEETKQAIAQMEAAGAFTFKPLRAGCSTTMVAALDPKLGLPDNKGELENVGVFLSDCQVHDKTTKGAVSSEAAERLWKVGEGMVKESFTL